MTRKDYIVLAGIFKDARYELQDADISGEGILHFIESRVKQFLADDNSRFDYGRFNKAAGGKEMK